MLLLVVLCNTLVNITITTWLNLGYEDTISIKILTCKFDLPMSANGSSDIFSSVTRQHKLRSVRCPMLMCTHVYANIALRKSGTSPSGGWGSISPAVLIKPRHLAAPVQLLSTSMSTVAHKSQTHDIHSAYTSKWQWLPTVSRANIVIFRVDWFLL